MAYANWVIILTPEESRQNLFDQSSSDSSGVGMITPFLSALHACLDF
jgi:hypothetical protein